MPTFEKEKEKVIYYSTSAIAERWCCSPNKVISVLEGHRGEKGFMDLGAAEDVRKHKRRYSIIRIHPALLNVIEASM
jgi:hypothetical protein